MKAFHRSDWELCRRCKTCKTFCKTGGRLRRNNSFLFLFFKQLITIFCRCNNSTRIRSHINMLKVVNVYVLIGNLRYAPHDKERRVTLFFCSSALEQHQLFRVLAVETASSSTMNELTTCAISLLSGLRQFPHVRCSSAVILARL